MSAQNDEQQQPAAGYVSMSNDTKLEAKLHTFNISSFIGLEF